GGRASMAMLGRTVFGVGRALSSAGFDPEAATLGAPAARRAPDDF
ncbi:MAG: hypothetical protein A07HB70_00190, partial [uncultured archaeon A07HB70]